MSDNRKRKGTVRIGYTSILLIFTMLCLVTFAALSLITVNSDYSLSQKVAERTTAYYEADTRVREYLSQIDKCLTDWYMTSNDADAYMSGLADVVGEVEVSDGLSTAMADDSTVYRIECQIGDVQKLCITLDLSYPEDEDDALYTIKEWKTVTENNIEQEALPLLK